GSAFPTPTPTSASYSVRGTGSSCRRFRRCHPPQFKFAVAILITPETKREDPHRQPAEQQDRIPHSVPPPQRDGGKPAQRECHAGADQHAHGIHDEALRLAPRREPLD